MTISKESTNPLALLQSVMEMVAADNSLHLKPRVEWPVFINYHSIQQSLVGLSHFELQILATGESDTMKDLVETYHLEIPSWFLNSMFDGELSEYFIVPLTPINEKVKQSLEYDPNSSDQLSPIVDTLKPELALELALAQQRQHIWNMVWDHIDGSKSLLSLDDFHKIKTNLKYIILQSK